MRSDVNLPQGCAATDIGLLLESWRGRRLHGHEVNEPNDLVERRFCFLTSHLVDVIPSGRHMSRTPTRRRGSSVAT